jgi:hypothetical protein
LLEGFIVLRRFNYGETIRRRELSVSAKGTQQEGQEAEMSMDINLSAVALYEYSKAIVEWNLEDENGNALNPKNAADVMKLDPSIAQEIEDHIDALNQPPSKDIIDPLPLTSGTSSDVAVVPETSSPA